MPQPPPMKFLDSMVRPNGLRVRPTFTTASPPPASAQLNNSASDRSMDATNDDTACSAPTTRKSLRLNKKRQRGGGQYDPEDADKRSSDGDANRTKRNYNRDSEGGDATAPFAQYAYKDPTSCSPGSGFEMDDRSQTETAGGVTEELYSLGSDETQSEGPEVGGPEVKKGGTVGGLMNEDENMYGQGRGEEGSEAGGLDEVISEVASLVEEYHGEYRSARFELADDAMSDDSTIHSLDIDKQITLFQDAYQTSTTAHQNSSQDRHKQHPYEQCPPPQQTHLDGYCQQHEYDAQGHRCEGEGEEEEEEGEKKPARERLDAKKVEARLKELQDNLLNGIQDMVKMFRSTEVVHTEMLLTFTSHRAQLEERDRVLKDRWIGLRGAAAELTQKTMTDLM